MNCVHLYVTLLFIVMMFKTHIIFAMATNTITAEAVAAVFRDAAVIRVTDVACPYRAAHCH